jgi:hypothetical protein
VRLRLVSLPRGSLLRLQPFTKRFLQVNGNDKFKVIAVHSALLLQNPTTKLHIFQKKSGGICM